MRTACLLPALLLIAGCDAKPAKPPVDQGSAPAAEQMSEAGSQAGPSTTDSPAASTQLTSRWTVDYAKSALKFEGSQTGTPFEGSFEKWEADIVFDPENLAEASIGVTVDMTSAKTGDRQRDEALPGSDWFKTREFPSARFQSTDIAKTGQGAYVAKGKLTIRGMTRDLDLPFTLKLDGPAGHAVGETALVRTDFGVGEGEFATGEWVGLDVKVKVDVTATR